MTRFPAPAPRHPAVRNSTARVVTARVVTARIVTARIIAGALAVGLAMLGTAGPALAHSVLVSSDPADGARLGTAPDTVSFTFNGPLQDYGPQLKIFGPGGNDFTAGAPTIDGSTISAPMLHGPAGVYRAAYRVVSADGHPVTGEISFTVTAAAAGTATGTVPTDGSLSPSPSGAAPSPAGDAGDGGGGGKFWLGIGIAVAGVLVLAAVVVALKPPKRPS